MNKEFENLIDVNVNNFEEVVLKSSTPVLVDIWAEWCGPCKTLEPIIKEISTELKDSLKVAKLNADENQDTAAKLGVKGLPTLLIFKEGEVIASKVGSAPKAQIVTWIKDCLNI